ALSWTPLGMVMANWEPLTGFFGGLWQGIMDSAARAWTWIKDTILGPLQAVKDTLGSAWNTVFGGGKEAPTPKMGAAMPKPVNDNAAAVGDVARAYNTDAGSAAKALSTVSQAAPPSGNVVPLRPQPAQAAQTAPVTITIEAPITIHAVAGMDEKAIARQVKIALQDAMREAEAKRRAANHD
ncbi:MAG: hypothetical protein AB1918_14495, partial [Pseudomonadota bacterium]